MFRTLAPIAAILLVSGCNNAPPAPPIAVEGAVVTLPAVAGRPSGAYFTLRSNSGPIRLISIASPKAERVELHETTVVHGMSRMGPLADAGFSPDAPLVFAPGGKHGMLFGLEQGLQPGGTIPLTFTFEGGAPVTVDAELRGPGDMADHSGH